MSVTGGLPFVSVCASGQAGAASTRRLLRRRTRASWRQTGRPHIFTRLTSSGLSSVLSSRGLLKRLLILDGFRRQRQEPGVLMLRRLQALIPGHPDTAILLAQGMKEGVRNDLPAVALAGRNPGLNLAKKPYYLSAGQHLFMGMFAYGCEYAGKPEGVIE